VRGLRHQRTQHRHQLCRVHIFDGDDLGDELFRTGRDTAGQIPVGHLARVGVRHDLDDAAGFHGDELVDLQQRQEGLVEGFRGHRRLRQHGDLRAHAPIRNDGLAGHLRHRFDDLADFHVAEVRRDALALALGADQAGGGEGHHQDQQACP